MKTNTILEIFLLNATAVEITMTTTAKQNVKEMLIPKVFVFLDGIIHLMMKNHLKCFGLMKKLKNNIKMILISTVK